MIARAAVAIAVIAVWSSRAEANTHPRVALEIDACVDVSEDEIRKLVAIELGALLSAVDESAEERTRASVSCHEDNVVLHVDDPITGKSMERALDVTDAIPRARPRLIALAIVELISASWTDLENAEPAPIVASEEPHVSSIAARLDDRFPAAPRRDEHASTRIVARGGGMMFFSRTSLLGGGGLELARDLSPRFGFIVDAQANHGVESTSLGQVDTDVLAVGAAITVRRAWRSHASPDRRAIVSLGAGVRAGAVHLTGVPDITMAVDGAQFWAPWFGPLALARVDFDVNGRITFGAALEGGYVALPVVGLVNGVRDVAISGAWLELYLGVGVIL
jgi:hypothetical protein